MILEFLGKKLSLKSSLKEPVYIIVKHTLAYFKNSGNYMVLDLCEIQGLNLNYCSTRQ